MGVGVASDLSAILDAIRAKLVADGLADESFVFVSLSDDDTLDKYPADELFIVVSPTRFLQDQHLFDGGGSSDLVFAGTINVALWIALATDLDRRDEDWLRDLTGGALPKWRAVLKSLSGFEPAAPGGGMLLMEPLRCVGFETRARRRAAAQWGKLTSWWEAKWWQDLS